MKALRFYAIVTLAGAVIMALEILSSRVLSPAFGNSVYVWGSIISVFLAALAAGYMLGGALADRAPELATLGRLLALAAACQVLLLWMAQPLARRIGDLVGESSWGPLLATSVLFGPTTVLLATVSPFAVRLAARDLPSLGNVAGRLYALSTAGSLAGTLGATFVLIPYLAIDRIFAILLVASVASALLAFADSWRSNALPLALALALLGFVPLQLRRDRRTDDVLVTRATPYQTLEVVATPDRRTLLGDGHPQSAVDLLTGEPALHYPRDAIAGWLFDDAIRRAVVLGLGGGSAGTYLQAQIQDVEIDFVEIDPAVPEIAREFLGFTTTERRRVHVADGRSFLAHNHQLYDLVYCDMYIGHSVPFHTTTVEFFELAKQRLADNGVLMVNVAASVDRPFSRALFSTIDRVFAQTYAFRVPASGNTVVVARTDGARLTREVLAERAAALDRRYRFAPSFTDIVHQLYPTEMTLRSQDVLRDELAPVDRLLHLERNTLGRQ